MAKSALSGLSRLHRSNVLLRQIYRYGDVVLVRRLIRRDNAGSGQCRRATCSPSSALRPSRGLGFVTEAAADQSNLQLRATYVVFILPISRGVIAPFAP